MFQSLQFCEGKLQQFCALTNTVVVWYFVGLLGALIICTGLLQFIATNSAKYFLFLTNLSIIKLCSYWK
jgi:hypothetical protein